MASRHRQTKPKRVSNGQAVQWSGRVTDWVKAHVLALLLVIGVGLLIATYLFLWRKFILPQYHIPPIECSALPIAVSLRYPHYVAVGDEGFVEVGVRNTGVQPISGTAVIAFGGDLSIHPVPSKTNFLSFTALPPNGIMADQVRFTFNEPLSRRNGTLPFFVQVTADQLCILSLPDSPLRLAPIPGLKTLLRAILSVLSSTVGIPLIGLLWEQIKKRLFPEKK
jgi:hypothetical protein